MDYLHCLYLLLIALAFGGGLFVSSWYWSHQELVKFGKHWYRVTKCRKTPKAVRNA